MPFEFRSLDLPGVVLIEPRVFADERGFFMETHRAREFAANGIDQTFVQENHSRSRRGTVRGLHFQREPAAQGKLVRVIVGEVFDVAVDIRPDSPTCGRWVGVLLSAANKHMLYIPPWCAHGFAVTSDEAELVYKVTHEYSAADEGGVHWQDPDLAIAWPVAEPILSDRDRRWPTLAALGLRVAKETSTAAAP